MAIETYKSDDLLGLEAVPQVKAHSHNRGKLMRQYFRIPPTVPVGDIGSMFNLVNLPAGPIRVFLFTSRIFWTAFGAARILDIGHRAYERIDGGIEPLVANIFDDDIVLTAAGDQALGSDYAPATFLADTHRFLSARGVQLFATVAGGTVTAGQQLEGWVDYATM